ncbi:hypothetical protein, partial [Stenotrophomonas maltophilia]|uniref:hypothetical protein n=1 Tax=Stenotrophomonas maltophilia TaxID=40324 RepID=UPI001953E8C3
TEIERRMAPPITVSHRMTNASDLDNHMRCRMGYPLPNRSWERESASEIHPYQRDMCGSSPVAGPAPATLESSVNTYRRPMK